MRPLTRARTRPRPAAADGEPLARLVDVHKRFEGKDVLRGVSLTVERGETMVIMGGSGSGKTVTLRCMAGAPDDSTPTTRMFGSSDFRALATPEIRPPPPIGTTTVWTSGRSS